jgi:hypothetical protein
MHWLESYAWNRLNTTLFALARMDLPRPANSGTALPDGADDSHAPLGSTSAKTR